MNEDFDWISDAFQDAFKNDHPSISHNSPFWDEVVDALIKEPDPQRREEILARMDPRTRANVESVYKERISRVLGELENE